jgi:TonB family protein
MSRVARALAAAVALTAGCVRTPIRSTGFGTLAIVAGAQYGRHATTFFEQVEERLARDWHPDAVALRADPSGALLDGKPRVIAVAVRLRPDGGVAVVELARSSGVPALDAEALDVFHRNQPYPAPPVGMLAEGVARFTLEFRFELERRAPHPAPAQKKTGA